MPPSISALKALAERWSGAKAAERANAQSYLIELCAALGVEPPRPAGSGYEFELPVRVMNRDGSEAQNFVDLYKQDHFLLEAKALEEGKSTDLLLRKAYGQARTYAANVPGGFPPPYVLVLDVAKTLLVWDRWAGSFGGFTAARRIDLPTLHEHPEDVALLVDIWTNPSARDPRTKSQAVTRDIAGHLAELAASLERRGLEQERVARFLMRCVFTMFAEDVHLLPDEPFRRILDEVALADPAEFAPAVEELWRAMDEGRRFGYRKLLKFNGHLFRAAEALPLERGDLATLLEAAKADWAQVEPSIFGTLLTRALDPVERHRLGAEYTPPEFIARVVRPAVEEPLRERWAAVQAEVLQLRESRKARDRSQAEYRLRAFHEWLRSLRFLDPACGSGNFLYVTMHAVKRLELEVLRELAEVTGAPELRLEEVDPSQFYGIEVKAWAREIAELTLWIGFHQFWRQHHQVQPAEPLLRDTGTLECRDAVLAWDEVRHKPERDRPDPTPRVVHPVTGQMVPDPEAKLPYMEYVNARPAAWPQAEFIIGNPPYLGKSRQREALGEGYVEAVRAAYPDVPDGADYVMYWWYRAAEEVARGRTIRAGLITTNSITQALNRPVVAVAAARGAHVTWAIADHVWYDGADGAEVRVAMTVLAKDPPDARLVEVAHAERVTGDVPIVREVRVRVLNADLSAHADVPGAAAVPLLANAGISALGFKPFGAGFVVSAGEAERLLAQDPRHGEVLKPFRNGKDLLQRSRGVYIIDFGLASEEEAREYPVLYDIVRNRVKPDRDASARAGRKQAWWRFGEPNPALRTMIAGLRRIIVTVETSKHHVFMFLPTSVAPEGGLVCIASDDPFVLGVLGSSIHEAWALAAGGRMGVRDTPRYNKRVCFEPFPFPDPTPSQRRQIANAAEGIEGHREGILIRDPKATITGVYNLLAKARAGAPLVDAERALYTSAACGVLKDLHEQLDRAVAEAYGWPWPEPVPLILERLVALHDQRISEEHAGKVRWLRPDHQRPRFARDAQARTEPLELADESETRTDAAWAQIAWPANAVGQITALRGLASAGPVSVEDALARFSGAPRAIVARHLETLAILGEVHELSDGRYGVAVAAQ